MSVQINLVNINIENECVRMNIFIVIISILECSERYKVFHVNFWRGNLSYFEPSFEGCYIKHYVCSAPLFIILLPNLPGFFLILVYEFH